MELKPKWRTGLQEIPSTCKYMYLRGEESVRERDLDIVPTYTTCNAPQYPCSSPYSVSGEYVLDSF
jgi:hypothetical protein